MNNILGNFAIVFVILAAFIGLMYVQQPGMIFFPISEINETPRDWGFEYEDVLLDTTDNIILHGWFIPHQGSKRTVLFFHGNAGNISHRGESVRIFHRLGLNVFIFDYRGYGKSQGKPGEQGLYKDADAAWNYLTQIKNIEPKNIIIFGRSLGGSVATKLASDVPAGKLILESTFSSGKDMAKSIFPIMSHFMYIRFDFNSEARIKKVNYPVLVVHSPDDEIIPYRLGEKVYQAANEPKTLFKLKGDHNAGFYLSQPNYEQALEQFLKQNQ